MGKVINVNFGKNDALQEAIETLQHTFETTLKYNAGAPIDRWKKIDQGLNTAERLICVVIGLLIAAGLGVVLIVLQWTFAT